MRTCLTCLISGSWMDDVSGFVLCASAWFIQEQSDVWFQSQIQLLLSFSFFFSSYYFFGSYFEFCHHGPLISNEKKQLRVQYTIQYQ